MSTNQTPHEPPDVTSDPAPEPSDPHTGSRSIELEIEVPGTPDEVWRAIATGPGISSWYVPHTFDEQEGAAAVASFGDGPDMQIPGRVAAWDPPHRIKFDGGEGVGGLAFEWFVEALDGGSCIVRLVNSGFGSGPDWDGQYDAMTDGWGLFLRNLALHLTYFRGRNGLSMLPMATWSGDTREHVWDRLCRALGIETSPVVGQRVVVTADGVAPLGGTVVDASPWRLALLLDEPAAGTGFIAAEATGNDFGVSVWSYLYGPEAASIVEHDKPRWQQWLEARA